MSDKIIWNIIDSYFKTIKNNLVNHQIDSYNMFVMEQLPKVIRQFNPITNYYNDNQVKLDIFIGNWVQALCLDNVFAIEHVKNLDNDA